MMEGMLTQRVTPLLKCVVLFLFIFTAKVLTSRPQESHDTKNNIHHLKPSHYVRTFTKYHHRRSIQWNNMQDLADYWPMQDQPKVIGKRSVDTISANDFVSGTDQDLNQLVSESVRSNIVGSFEKNAVNSNKEDVGHNTVSSQVKQYKVKAAMIVTDAPTTKGPTISCLYKIHNVAISVTPSYDEEKNAQLVVENEIFDTPGTLSETTLPSGEVAQVEHCTDPRAFCYTLWHQDKDGNITVMGQGCWRSSQTEGCDKCTRVTARLPGSKFCCCTKSYCNADFLSLKEEMVTVKAESTMSSSSQQPKYPSIIASGILALVSVLVIAIMCRNIYCRKTLVKDDLSDATDVEKGDVMGSGPDALATGLLCVDNLNLIEHIGQGKFGSVWRGTLGSTPVAVKLYSNASAWQKEATIYGLPHLAHPNLLRYYGSETRSTMTEGMGREHLVVLELCSSTLRARLERAPLTWLEFATLAHGLAAALAHLHTASGNKPCVVHRDVNSNNVLVSGDGRARLADLGLAQPLPPRRDRAPPTTITEAGTLRYLSPEALEGALDLSGARAALCAVDVFALSLVLWEMLWRCAGAHPARAPPYAPPYHHLGLPPQPTLAQMQSLVSRNKARPPLPKGPVPEARALKIATDTCDECWDHDAEARLTAVCVEERMSELKMMLLVQGPVIHDNNLHPHSQGDSNIPSTPETDKNSNCTAATNNGDVSTPLLYTQPHIGRNACIERNTHDAHAQTHTAHLVHKSLKDIPADTHAHAHAPQQNVLDNCLSVARVSRNTLLAQENSDRLNEIRSYQRPLEYVPNDVSSHDVDRRPKQTNLLQDLKTEKPRWGIRKFFERKLGRAAKPLETEVKLIAEGSANSSLQNGRTKTSLIDKPNNITFDRPTNLVLNQSGSYNFEGPCTLSPPNRTLSPTMMMESENRDRVFKELPSRDEKESRNQIFAVIVPKAKPADVGNMSKTSRGSSESLNKNSIRTSMSSQSNFKAGNSESEDSTAKKRLSCDNRIISNSSNSGRSSRASINLELQYIDTNHTEQNSPFDINSDCSSSEDENLMLLSENGGSKITMQTIPKLENDKKRLQNEVLKETGQTKTDYGFNKYANKYANFDNEFSDPNDKENAVNGYSGDNPVYLAALNGEIDTTDFKFLTPPTDNGESSPKSPKPSLKSLSIKRQHSLEHVSEIFSSSGSVNLQNPAGRVKTPGDLPVAVRRARRDRALQKGRASECNRLSLYDDRMMFGNSL
ncbi:Bone morphogenetic protein receptor type-2 [Papilio xuthus]|uniref:Serine/threonine-protein kinase receptor n=1 Tax=Papilio xuthus TaxID=66420 RepID=A0A194PZE8_PAPXU|nr:Bone morphogenetic protein receptor type-2 [Papilio xuthus]